VDVCSNGSGSYRGESEHDLIYTVSRDRFDNALIQKAVSAGAVLKQEHRVREIVTGNGHISVHTDRGDFSARFLAGADGARSVVAGKPEFNNRMDYITGITAEISLDEGEMKKRRGRVVIDLTMIRGGYAWIFPKSGYISAGIASIKNQAVKLKPLFSEFLDENGIDESKIVRRRGAIIPVCKKNPVFASGNMALLGDAAGMADPLSGEGIYYAALSARLLATSIRDCVQNNVDRLDSYQQAVYKKIMPEIRMARVLQKIFIHFPNIPVKLLNYDARAWRGCCYFARGELSYCNARQLIGGYRGMKELLMGALNGR